jgi:hypothetical protein
VFFFHHNQPKVRRLTQQDSLQYLGATEDYTFLLNADKGIVLVLRADSFSGMSLSPSERAKKAK